MSSRILFALSFLSLAACAQDDAVDTQGEAIARAPKVDVCHYDEEEDAYEIINISSNATGAHISNHGDWLVTEEVCGDGIDNDCDGQVDEECCPCTETIDAAALAAERDTTYSYCYDDYYYYDLEGYAGYGYDAESDYGVTYLYAYDFTGTWYESYYGQYACQAGDYDYDHGVYNYTGVITLNADEWASCVDEVNAIQDAEGCDYTY